MRRSSSALWPDAPGRAGPASRQKARAIRVLLIEDDEEDFSILEAILSEVSSARYELTWAQTYDRGLEELCRGGYDVCFLDYRLGPKSGLDLLSRVAKSATAPPIIVLTGQGDYRVDLKAMEYGAADYIVKDEVSAPLLERAIRYAIDRLKSQRALRESESQLKHLATALLKVQENERRKVAAELHDDFGQFLAAMKFHIESVLERMEPGDPCAPDLRELIPGLQGAIERVRNMYTELMPSVLDDLGILATLRWFCREFQEEHPHIAVQFEFGISEQAIAHDLKLVIFRIVQDAFKNVAGHSGASQIKLSLSARDDSLSLAVRDNGKGFDIVRALASTSSHNGLGLMSMKRRAELSGGSFTVESAETRGTSVCVRWHIESRQP